MQLLHLPTETLKEVTKYLDLISLAGFLSTCKEFWSLRPQFDEDFFTFSQIALRKEFNTGLCKAIERNDFQLIQWCIKKGAKDWNLALRCSAYAGNHFLIDFFAKKGACNWVRAMVEASRAGRLGTVQYLIRKGDIKSFTPANNLPRNHHWNLALEAAFSEGHSEVAQFLITCGANCLDSSISCSPRSSLQPRHRKWECQQVTQRGYDLETALIQATEEGLEEVAVSLAIKHRKYFRAYDKAAEVCDQNLEAFFMQRALMKWDSQLHDMFSWGWWKNKWNVFGGKSSLKIGKENTGIEVHEKKPITKSAPVYFTRRRFSDCNIATKFEY